MEIEKPTANPKFEVLYLLVRELNLPLEQVFYPESLENSEVKEELMRAINECSEEEVDIILGYVKRLKNMWSKTE